MSSSKCSRVYRRKHRPALVRPARPALCLACTALMDVTFRESIPVAGSYSFCLVNPGSTTKTTPGTVSDVSARLVATTTRLHPAGGGAKTLA